jgi:hypothetical protein
MFWIQAPALIGYGLMPLHFKLPGYIGNVLLLLLSVIILASDNVVVGALLGALAVLNLFLIYKLDQISRQEVWLAHELEMTKMREALLAAQKRIADLQATPAPQDTRPKQNGAAAH